MRVAAIQMNSGANVDKNLQTADRLFAKAAEDECQLVVLPENFALMPRNARDKVAHAEQPGNGPIQTFLADAEHLDADKSAVNAHIPIFLCHGQQDQVLPMAMGQSACRSLKEASYPVEWREYPMGHEVCQQEIQDISLWLQSLLG